SRPAVHRSVQLPGLEGKIQPPTSPSRCSRSPPSHTIIVNPHISPDDIHTATRLHHRLKKSHAAVARQRGSSVAQRSSKTCASLTTKKNDRHHHGSNTPIRRGNCFFSIV
ncbi:unnamed protein product, partial [Ectocarpus sp. 12 AP-2014]